MSELTELLAKAIELEEKAADLLDRDFTPDAREDYEALAEAPTAEAVAELSARLESLHDQMAAVADATPPGVAPVADYEAGDIDELPEVDEKGWADFDAASLAAFEAASAGVEVKGDEGDDDPEDEDEDEDEPVGMDFDEPDDEPSEEKGDPLEDAWFDEEPETKALDDGAGVLSEFELLRAQRAALGL